MAYDLHQSNSWWGGMTDQYVALLNVYQTELKMKLLGTNMLDLKNKPAVQLDVSTVEWI